MKTGKFADFSNDVKFSGRELEGECGFQLDAPPHDSHFVVRFSQYCVIMNSNEVLGKNGRSSLLGTCNIKRVFAKQCEYSQSIQSCWDSEFEMKNDDEKSSLSCRLYPFEKW